MAGFVLDVFFPRRCAWCGEVQGFASFCDCYDLIEDIRLADRPLNNQLFGTNMQHMPIWAVFAYRPPIDGAVLRLKNSYEESTLEQLALSMSEKFSDCQLWRDFDLIIPVPASRKTMRARGFNQAELLARKLSFYTGVPVAADCLVKSKETLQQKTLRREERRYNLIDAYEVPASVRQSGILRAKNVILIDDVVTTGATLQACAHELWEAGVYHCGALCLTAAM